jgi:hypothetical protein
MRGLPADSVDAVVTDPPYELGFMGKSWDSAGVSYDPATWAEALRVLKPGGHLLAFGGSRTYHRIAVAIEDAGFEIRDSLMWIYGSGFPKSLDVSKAMDKRRNDRGAVEQVREFLHTAWKRSGLKSSAVDAHFGFKGSMSGPHWFYKTSQNTVPTWDQWLELQRLLGFGTEMDQTVLELNGRKGTPGEAWAEREVVGHFKSSLGGTVAAGERNQDVIEEHRNKVVPLTTPATEEAKQWEGWGTALKPSHEPIVLARKPLIGTVAENVLAHGTGALNIGASRIGDDSITTSHTVRPAGDALVGLGAKATGETSTHIGRWPANTLWDEEAAAQLDASTPAQPSRFFYVAKPGKRERNAGLDELPQGFLGGGDTASPTSNRKCLLCGLVRFAAKRCECPAPQWAEAGKQANTHPTVKPIALMRYLIKLVTPPGGVVLDPFLGSGTTACAAVLEGFDYIGIEQTPEYADIAEARIAHYSKEEING